MRPHRTARRLSPGSAVISVAGAAVVVAATFSFCSASQDGMPRSTQTVDPRPVATDFQTTSEPDPAHPADPAGYQVQRLSEMKDIVAAHKSVRISGEASRQPDIYAAEFVRRLLTQDYRQPREAHLAWVQAESAATSEPLVVGLVPPELRDRLAVYTVSDESLGPTPIPSAALWRSLGNQRAYTKVTVERIVEPGAWTNAVAAGRISDPGATAREVTAAVTRHARVDGRASITRFKVVISLNLEGPPVRATWGFVAAVAYTSTAVS